MLARRPAAPRPAGYLLPSGYWRAGCLLRQAGLASPFGRPDLPGRRFGGRAGPCGRSGAQLEKLTPPPEPEVPHDDHRTARLAFSGAVWSLTREG